LICKVTLFLLFLFSHFLFSENQENTK